MDFNYKLYPGRKLEIREKVEEKEPIISIITPFYNSKQYIEQTAISVLNQTYPYFEWIIVDDGSEDKESIEVLKNIEKMDSRIKVFHKENQGLAQTRDFGAKESNKSSKYLVFLDDDDCINKTFLECAYWTLETNNKATWAYVDTINFGGMEFLWKKWFDIEQEKKDNLLVAMAMIRKTDFIEIGGYSIKEKAVYEDWNLWLKLLSKGKYPVRISFPGFWYRKKPVIQSELSRATANREKAMQYINKTASQITEKVEAIQYPKQDYNWDILEDKLDILTPKRFENGKINILMIIPWMTTGGADKFNLDLITKLDKNKYSVTVITTEPNTNPLRQAFEEVSVVYDLTSFLDRKYWINFIDYIIQSNNINIILNTNSTFGYASLPYIKAKHSNIPIVDYVHMEEWYNRNGGFSRDSSMISSVIDKTFVCNENSRNILIDYFKRKENEVQTVYVGVDENIFNIENYNKKEILEKYNINKENKLIISYIARISEQKRPNLLLEIIHSLKQKRNDFIFIVAGDGNMLSSIKQKAKKMDIDSNIVFLGNVKNTEEIYAISDITINCSIKEGLALTSYESLSMGVPVISADVGGQKELIDENVGVIVPCLQNEKDIYNFNYSKEEIENYVLAIEKITKNLEDYKKNARKAIENKFTIDKMIEKMDYEITNITQNPNKEKITNGENLKNCIDITKELISKYFSVTSIEYNWLCEEFNKKYIGIDYKNYNNTSINRQVKNLTIKITKKLHIYNFLKCVFGNRR